MSQKVSLLSSDNYLSSISLPLSTSSISQGIRQLQNSPQHEQAAAAGNSSDQQHSVPLKMDTTTSTLHLLKKQQLQQQQQQQEGGGMYATLAATAAAPAQPVMLTPAAAVDGAPAWALMQQIQQMQLQQQEEQQHQQQHQQHQQQQQPDIDVYQLQLMVEQQLGEAQQRLERLEQEEQFRQQQQQVEQLLFLLNQAQQQQQQGGHGNGGQGVSPSQQQELEHLAILLMQLQQQQPQQAQHAQHVLAPQQVLGPGEDVGDNAVSLTLCSAPQQGSGHLQNLSGHLVAAPGEVVGAHPTSADGLHVLHSGDLGGGMLNNGGSSGGLRTISVSMVTGGGGGGSFSNRAPGLNSSLVVQPEDQLYQPPESTKACMEDLLRAQMDFHQQQQQLPPSMRLQQQQQQGFLGVGVQTGLSASSVASAGDSSRHSGFFTMVHPGQHQQHQRPGRCASWGNDRFRGPRLDPLAEQKDNAGLAGVGHTRRRGPMRCVTLGMEAFGRRTAGEQMEMFQVLPVRRTSYSVYSDGSVVGPSGEVVEAGVQLSGANYDSATAAMVAAALRQQQPDHEQLYPSEDTDELYVAQAEYHTHHRQQHQQNGRGPPARGYSQSSLSAVVEESNLGGGSDFAAPPHHHQQQQGMHGPGRGLRCATWGAERFRENRLVGVTVWEGPPGGPAGEQVRGPVTRRCVTLGPEGFQRRVVEGLGSTMEGSRRPPLGGATIYNRADSMGRGVPVAGSGMSGNAIDPAVAAVAAARVGHTYDTAPATAMAAGLAAAGGIPATVPQGMVGGPGVEGEGGGYVLVPLPGGGYQQQYMAQEGGRVLMPVLQQPSRMEPPRWAGGFWHPM